MGEMTNVYFSQIWNLRNPKIKMLGDLVYTEFGVFLSGLEDVLLAVSSHDREKKSNLSGIFFGH